MNELVQSLNASTLQFYLLQLIMEHLGGMKFHGIILSHLNLVRIVILPQILVKVACLADFLIL